MRVVFPPEIFLYDMTAHGEKVLSNHLEADPKLFFRKHVGDETETHTVWLSIFFLEQQDSFLFLALKYFLPKY